MSEPEFLDTAAGRRIAYRRTEGSGPGVVFLGGFVSDMEGTKAVHLEAWASERGRAFLRFDYSGHGASSGEFAEGAIGDWAADAMAVIEAVADGPQILVGSSMGGWISLLVARALPAKVAGMVTVAAAPDFTEDGFWASFGDAERSAIMEEGGLQIPSDYGAPYVITERLILDGRENLVLRTPLVLPFPVRMLQGTADREVPMDTALRLLGHATADDLRLTLVKGADHRFSTPDCLAMIERAVDEVTEVLGGRT
ncbi:MAG: alpha/beta hydrolase [Rhodobacteraceae bacterium]|nr:alpha/beta hydrolase [Paracoccaceae bacterium]